jgi:hypothetical protein
VAWQQIFEGFFNLQPVFATCPSLTPCLGLLAADDKKKISQIKLSTVVFICINIEL